MSGPEPPHTEARVSYSNHITFPLKSLPRTEKASRLSGPPQAPTLVTPGKVTAKSLPTIIKGTLLITSERKIHLLSIQSYPESSRQPQHPQISRTLKKTSNKIQLSRTERNATVNSSSMTPDKRSRSPHNTAPIRPIKKPGKAYPSQ